MTRVLVNGFKGRMGTEVVRVVYSSTDLELVGGVDPVSTDSDVFIDGIAVAPAFTDLNEALAQTKPHIVVDFTLPSVVESNIRTCIAASVNVVVGTTGLSKDVLASIEQEIPPATTVFIAPNFTTGAVLMMAFSKIAARFFPDAEVIEFHHNRKVDAPSGTALATARAISEERAKATLPLSAPGKETELSGCEGARGALVEDVYVHAVRSNGFVASQEVIFGSPGQTLTIRHDSIDRSSYMPGVLLAIREVASGAHQGMVIGLENLMDIQA